MPQQIDRLDLHHSGLGPALRAGLTLTNAEVVIGFYDQPHRHYHQRTHLLEMFNAAVEFRLDLSASQTLAVLFHDAVYVPGAARGANEALSAQLMRIYAGEVAIKTLDAAFSIIIDTADHVPRSAEAEAVLDLDLMRLGASPEDFARESRQIFAEQRPLIATSDDQEAWEFFDGRRVAFFEIVLARPVVFHGATMRERFERPCRANLSAAIENARRHK